MRYLLLGLSIVLEVIGSSFMQASNGFTKPIPTIVVAVSYLACFFLFSQVLKEIPLGVAYAIWAGLGIVLTALISVFVFHKPMDLPAILGVILIVSGVVVMNLFSKTAGH